MQKKVGSEDVVICIYNGLSFTQTRRKLCVGKSK